MVHVKLYLLLRQLTKSEIPSDIQALLFKVNIKIKWFFLCIYKPPSMNSQCFLGSSSNIIDYYSNVDGNCIVIGDFNLEPSQVSLETFMETHNYFNLIKITSISKDLDPYKKNMVFKVLSHLKQDSVTLLILYLKVYLRRKNLNKLSIVIEGTFIGSI